MGAKTNREIVVISNNIIMTNPKPIIPVAARIIRVKLDSVSEKSVMPRTRFSRKKKQTETIPIVALVDRAMPLTPKNFINRTLNSTFRKMEKIPIYRSTLAF